MTTANDRPPADDPPQPLAPRALAPPALAPPALAPPALAPPALALVSDDVPDDTLDLDELASRIVGLAGRIAAATCRWLLLIADFDRREGFAPAGLGSTARWLSHYCGIAPRTAKEHVRVARTLARHPALITAMSAGRISFSHVRAISRIADAGTEQLVEELVNVAEHGTVGQLETMVRGLRTVDDNESGRIDETPEYTSNWWGSDSRWHMNARLDPENGALVRAAVSKLAHTEKISPAQALVRMAEIAMAAMADQPPVLRGDERTAVLVHLDVARLPDQPAEPAPAPDEGCSAEHPPRPAGRIDRGPGLPARVVKRLLCAGRVRTILHGDGRTVLDLGRSRRIVPDRMFLALLARDSGCRFPGCGSRYGLEAHHVRHWLDGGRTDMRNLILLCRNHHHRHHEGGFEIRRLGAEPGSFEFVRSDGRVVPESVDPSEYRHAAGSVDDDHASIAADAATTAWDGSRLDHHYAVSTLAQGLRVARGENGPPPGLGRAS